MQALYEIEFGAATLDEALTNFFHEEKIEKGTMQFARELAEGSLKSMTGIDPLISKYSKGWPLDRIGGVDRSILRLAFFELTENITPHQVVINEALEMSKKYSTNESAKFINGVLGSYVKEHKKKGA